MRTQPRPGDVTGRCADRMVFLDETVRFRAHGREYHALVIDDGRVFARWIDGGGVHLHWVQARSVARRVGAS